MHPQDPNQYFLVDTEGDIRAAFSQQIEKQLRSTLQEEQKGNRGMRVVIEVIEDRWLRKGTETETRLVVQEIEIDRLSGISGR